MSRPLTALFVAVALGCIGCDAAVKQLAVEVLEHRDPIEPWGEFMRFELARNPGAFLSLGAGLPTGVRSVLLLGVAPLLLVFVVVSLLRSGATGLREVFALALLTGGGLSNWLERLLNDGHVTDFVSIGIGSVRSGIFNGADVAIVMGVGALALSLRERDQPEAPLR